MLKTKLVPLGFSLVLAIADFNPLLAFPIAPHALSTVANPTSGIELARFARGGGYRGVAGRGGYGYRRGAHVAHRGYGYRRGVHVAHRGYGIRRAPVARAAAVGRYRVGGRYYGGVWYGTGRRYYGGRWWPYGVGSCWRSSPIGYVWVCG
jgi:hypothetical protein